MPKAFLNCPDGDKIRIEFEYDEERIAFEDISTRMCVLLDAYRKGTNPLPYNTSYEAEGVYDVLITQDLMETTLQTQVAREHLLDLRKVFSQPEVLNIMPSGEVILSFRRAK